MAENRIIVPSTAAGQDAAEIVPYENMRNEQLDDLPESSEEAERSGPAEVWKFWDGQIKAALTHENRWRQEAAEAEKSYFGPDDDPGRNGAAADPSKDPNPITDRHALIHANIDVLKPLIYSDTPQPVVRRRFYGDGKVDHTAVMAAEAGQRLADFLIDDTDFDNAMEIARDDWLIAGRGSARVLYKAEFQAVEEIDPAGNRVLIERKVAERVDVAPVEWIRQMFAAAASWDKCPWEGVEIPMSRKQVEDRFGKDISDRISYNTQGLQDASRGISDEDRDHGIASITSESETGAISPSPFDTVNVVEIWNKTEGKVIWWSKDYTDGLLDEQDDTLGLEKFYPMPRPLTATTKGQALTPRPDIKYYERRAKEVELASKKMKSILDVLSISGLFPGSMQEDVKKLLKGDNIMIPVTEWMGLLEKGSINGIIQWLPIDAMIKAVQALQALREQAKEAMFEASGVSDVMRASSDPSETATAQQIKGRYAGLRLSERQKRMAIFARDMIRLMVEVGLEHFDTATIADICALDLPMTEAERQAAIAYNERMTQQHQQALQTYAMMQQAEQQGRIPPGTLPPPPKEPQLMDVADTSWELVHERLRNDYGRKITLTIETQSTVLADEQADKEARIEFLSAFATFVAELAPLAGSGQFDYKTVKELLLFGVRGFPKSRTLESLISSLPDEPQGEPPEETQITVTKIKGEIDRALKEMEMADKDKERAHEKDLARIKVGGDLVGKAAEAAMDASDPGEKPTMEQPQQQGAT
ncbi:hypothetical protein [Pseudooceanicola atlanticus]|uniref:hypothetical protein n=1 Tax=Pseudooceanicola atlanticus TaxID=1461694 RepID=UPI0023520D2C|nr:hypothetical protein [Pseudooceanicola atlanticus]